MKTGCAYRRILVLAALAAAFCGCQPMPESRLTLDELIAAHNHNASRIPRLWARVKIEATFPVSADDGQPVMVTWGSVSPMASPNGLLLLAKSEEPSGPHDVVLIGRETAAVELVRVGSSVSEGVYYFWYHFGDDAAALWGRNDLAGANGVESLPINPHDLLAVLNVCMLPADRTTLPAVALTMRTTPSDYAYEVNHIYHQPVSKDILLTRQTLFTWSDSAPPWPFEVKFFDASGMPVMTAKLKDYKNIGAGREISPHIPVMMPTDIEITWPASKSRVHLVLSEMTMADKFSRAACRFRDNLPAMSEEKIIQIDRNIRTEGPTQ
jgi:hypothetical protein